MLKNKPILSIALIFSIFPITYYFIDYLTISRTGKILFPAVSTIALTYMLYLKYKNSFFKWLFIILTVVMFVNMQFHVFIKDIFGFEQEDILIIKTILATNKNESLEFFEQYKLYILKHILLLLTSLVIFLYFALKKNSLDTVKITKAVFAAWILFFISAHIIKSIRQGNPFVYFPYYYKRWVNDLNELNNIYKNLEKNINSKDFADIKYISKKRKSVVVWIIGESSTKYNWSLYGYKRDTTPLIKSIKKDILVFNNIKAAGPITIDAFEKMFTLATITKRDLWKKSLSLVQIAKKAGYHVYWISNHTTDKYSSIINIFANQSDEFIMTNKGKARGEGSYDETVLEPYKKALNDSYDKKFIIVHLLESHPAYNYRYPKNFAKWTKEFDDTVAKELANKNIAKWAIVFRNLYDNSVLYSDYIHYKLLKLLQNSKEANNSVWLYHPDHGEDVCHHNNFSGHNPKVKEQWDIPMLFWSKDLPKVDVNVSYQLDNINNTILGLLKVKTKNYNPKYDLFNHKSP